MGKIEKLKDRRWRSATTEASSCEEGGALVADFHGSGRGNRFQVCQFKKLGLKIPPHPPFSKGGTIPFSFEKRGRYTSPFEKGGSRGILKKGF
jgi:hypothetical protein